LEGEAGAGMMDAYRIFMSLDASDDLKQIHEYISRESQSRAAGMIEKIFASIDRLEKVPKHAVAESVHHSSGDDVRSVSVYPYIIYFLVSDTDKVVNIIHIRHGSRRGPSRLD
jgi:plasmid stabilization system protein ParE